MSMGMLWALSASLPSLYTHSDKEGGDSPPVGAAKNPLLTSFQFLMKLVCNSYIGRISISYFGFIG